MNFFDIILVIILLYFSIKGFIHGLVKEFISTIAFFISAYATLLYFHKTELYAKLFIDEYSPYFKILVFIVTFILIFILIKIIEWLISKLIEKTGLSVFNRIGGFLFGLIKGGILIMIALQFILKLDAKFNFLTSEIREKSLLYKPLKEYSDVVFPFLKEKINDRINSK